jgi:hypothetical protein
MLTDLVKALLADGWTAGGVQVQLGEQLVLLGTAPLVSLCAWLKALIAPHWGVSLCAWPAAGAAGARQVPAGTPSCGCVTNMASLASLCAWPAAGAAGARQVPPAGKPSCGCVTNMWVCHMGRRLPLAVAPCLTGLPICLLTPLAWGATGVLWQHGCLGPACTGICCSLGPLAGPAARLAGDALLKKGTGAGSEMEDGGEL